MGREQKIMIVFSGLLVVQCPVLAHALPEGGREGARRA